MIHQQSAVVDVHGSGMLSDNHEIARELRVALGRQASHASASSTRPADQVANESRTASIKGSVEELNEMSLPNMALSASPPQQTPAAGHAHPPAVDADLPNIIAALTATSGRARHRRGPNVNGSTRAARRKRRAREEVTAAAAAAAAEAD